MFSIEKLQPANKADIQLYTPYYGRDRHKILPYALSLYQQGFLEGERRIEGTKSIPFVATWYVSRIPAELTRCRLQFEGNAELSYEINLTNSEFVNSLIDLIKNFQASRQIDFSQAFYRKLLHLEA